MNMWDLKSITTGPVRPSCRFLKVIVLAPWNMRFYTITFYLSPMWSLNRCCKSYDEVEFNWH